jgi:Flp pilus assembly protein TadD
MRRNTNEEIDSLDSEVLNVKGLNLARNGYYLEALLCFQKAVEVNPNNAHAWYNYGTGLTKVGKYDDTTLMCFEKAVELNPTDPEAWNNKGAILAHLGRKKEAFDCYSRVTELNPGHARAWQNMGLLYEMQGSKKAAKECFARARKSGV